MQVLNRCKSSLVAVFVSCLLAMTVVSGSAHAQIIVTKDFTGIWDQPDQESQGLVVQIVGQPDGSKQGVVFWFTYDDNGLPYWLIGQGDVLDNQVELEFLEVSGPVFLEPSNPASRNAEVWGSGRLTFDNCQQGRMDIEPARLVPSNTPRQFRIQRLAQVFSTECSGGISDDIPPTRGRLDIEIALNNTGLDPDASGTVELETGGGRAEFSVEVEDLEVGNYDLLVNAVVVGVIVVKDDGIETEGEIEFRSPLELGHPLLNFDPTGSIIEVVRDGLIYLSSEPFSTDEGDDVTGTEVEIEVDMVNSGVYPFGSADAEFEQHSERREFRIEVEDIPVGTYTLRVGGVGQGSIILLRRDDENEGELEFSDPLEVGSELLDFDPRNMLIEILEGETLLFSVNFPGQPVGDSDDDDDDGRDDDDPNSLSIMVQLLNSGVDSNASGTVEFEIEAGNREFEVEVRGLDDGAYNLVVAGQIEGTIQVRGGEGEVEFSDLPDEDELPLNFDPRGQLIRVDRAGITYLSVNFPS